MDNIFKEKILISVTDKGMKANMTLNLAPNELKMENRSNLVKEVTTKLKENGIVFGIKKEVFEGELSNHISYVIAEGTLPVNGTDSIINMHNLKEAKPEVGEHDKADFYDLKLINRVTVDDWIGERIEPTNGKPGQTVRGEVIQPGILKGNSIALKYDKNSVKEVPERNKTVLRAKISGAVSCIDGKITVLKNLAIEGDVNFKTGNIKFDGYVTIKGTVTDGFSVEATRDIEINGELGLGNAKAIISTGGSIFIKGGIASSSKTEIKAARNVFTKFANNSVITCGGAAHFGYYCINNIVNAKEVVIDSSNGHIIGGNIKAEVRVLSPTIGSEAEKKTVIEVTGFNKAALKGVMEGIFHQLGELKNEQQKLKQILSAFSGKDESKLSQSMEYSKNSQRMTDVKELIKDLEEKRNSMAGYLKTRGEGEICITNRIFPKSVLIIKNKIIEISSMTYAKSFYIQDGEIKET